MSSYLLCWNKYTFRCLDAVPSLHDLWRVPRTWEVLCQSNHCSGDWDGIRILVLTLVDFEWSDKQCEVSAYLQPCWCGVLRRLKIRLWDVRWLIDNRQVVMVASLEVKMVCVCFLKRELKTFVHPQLNGISEVLVVLYWGLQSSCTTVSTSTT